MKLGELIEELQGLQAQHGWELPVQVAITTGPGAWRTVDLDRVRYSYFGGAGNAAARRGESIALETTEIGCTIHPTT
jgi:hypothetical protein